MAGRPPFTNGGDFLIQDHGLFATGIVHDVGPAAEVHLIRVLNHYGVGTQMELAYVLDQLPTLIQGASKSLVANLSLTFAVPQLMRYVELYLPNTFKDCAAQDKHGGANGDIQGLHSLAQLSVARPWRLL